MLQCPRWGQFVASAEHGRARTGVEQELFAGCECLPLPWQGYRPRLHGIGLVRRAPEARRWLDSLVGLLAVCMSKRMRDFST